RIHSGIDSVERYSDDLDPGTCPCRPSGYQSNHHCAAHGCSVVVATYYRGEEAGARQRRFIHDRIPDGEHLVQGELDDRRALASQGVGGLTDGSVRAFGPATPE